MENDKPKNKLQFPPVFNLKNIRANSWDSWLKHTEDNLKKAGYVKYVQNFKSEDFSYWKSFKIKEKSIYQIGILFYDFRKYIISETKEDYGIRFQYDCMILDTEDRIELVVNKNTNLKEFEKMSKKFYYAMQNYK
jgi:hypothetical protein